MAAPPRVAGALRAHVEDSPFTRRVLLPAARFIEVEEIAGGPLVLAAVAALVWANSPFGESYETVWSGEIAIDFWGWSYSHTARDWINEALLPLLFFVAGLELKRELTSGELSSVRRAAFPAAVAAGGMAVPALTYVALNLGPGGATHGWGVPLATDIAFALAILALAGPTVPTELKTIVLAFAAIDDVGSVLVIALFYASDLAPAALAAGAVLLASVYGLKRAGVRQVFPYWLLGAGMCAAVAKGGVHPTVAAVVLGLLAPSRPFFGHERMVEGTRALDRALSDLEERPSEESEGEEEMRWREKKAEALGLIETLAAGAEPITERLSRQVNPWVSYVILPLFALANAGVAIGAGALTRAVGDPAALGVAAGLIVGKPVGFLSFAWAATAIGIATRPRGVSWRDLTAGALLAGIGFTVSLFIAELAFGEGDGERLASIKLAVLAASVVAGIAGWATLRMGRSRLEAGTKESR